MYLLNLSNKFDKSSSSWVQINDFDCMNFFFIYNNPKINSRYDVKLKKKKNNACFTLQNQKGKQYSLAQMATKIQRERTDKKANRTI